jgi:hypothetical protein
LATSSATELWEVIAQQAASESALWRDALRPDDERELLPIFSALGEERFALGLETIYEGYLMHYGRSRLFDAPDSDTALLLGDYLYAHGLVRIADSDGVASVADLAELISLSAQVRAEGRNGDGPLWAATAALLGTGALDEARAGLRLHGDAAALDALAREAAGSAAVEHALATHRGRLR